MTPELIEKIAKIEANTACLPDLANRLAKLERDRAWALGWFAGALAIGSTLGALLARVVGFLAVALGLASCGGPFCDDVFGVPARWSLSTRPVPVLVSEGLSGECQDGVTFALDFWVAHGVTYLSPSSVRETATLVHVPGAISVSAREPRRDDILGVAQILAFAGSMFSAKIQLRDCDPLVVAHEFGHALGLAHVDEYRNIMHPTSGGQSAVTDEQREQVR